MNSKWFPMYYIKNFYYSYLHKHLVAIRSFQILHNTAFCTWSFCSTVDILNKHRTRLLPMFLFNALNHCLVFFDNLFYLQTLLFSIAFLYCFLMCIPTGLIIISNSFALTLLRTICTHWSGHDQQFITWPGLFLEITKVF